ncbi:unnamed protein product, partial [marine sediment metagenome]
TRKRRQPEPPLAEQGVLRNEYFELRIDPTTGSIHSLTDYHTRGNRLTQQLALRMPAWASTLPVRAEEQPEMLYSVMAADEVVVTASNTQFGEIISRGRLVDRHARRLAGFEQALRVRRGSRVLEFDIRLDVEREPDPDPWNSYYALRLAWGDATAEMCRSVHLTSQSTDGVQLEAPHFVDVRGEKTRTTLLSGGLPYHRRFGLRKLDTLLVVRGETARRFRLGIAVDLPHPAPAALSFLAPPKVLSQ